MGADSFIKSQMHRMPTYDEVLYDTVINPKDRINLPDRMATQLRNTHQPTRFDEVDQTPDLAAEQTKITKERIKLAAIHDLGGMGPDDTVSVKRAEALRTNYTAMVERGKSFGNMISRGVKTQGDVRAFLQVGLDRAFRATPIGQGITEYQAHRKAQRGNDIPALPPQKQTEIRDNVQPEISPYPPRRAGIHEYMQRATIQALSFSPFAQGYADREYQRQQHDLDVAHRLNHDHMQHIREAKHTQLSQSAREARNHLEASSSTVRPIHLGGGGAGTLDPAFLPPEARPSAPPRPPAVAKAEAAREAAISARAGKAIPEGVSKLQKMIGNHARQKATIIARLLR